MDKKLTQESRRDFLKKVGYVAPVILTMNALPSLARAGSPFRGGPKGNEGLGNGEDPCPPGHMDKPNCNFNDEPAVPGEPGAHS
jgi:hypothetical protein